MPARLASLHRYLLEDCPDLVHNLQEVHHSPSFDDFSVTKRRTIVLSSSDTSSLPSVADFADGYPSRRC